MTKQIDMKDSFQASIVIVHANRYEYHWMENLITCVLDLPIDVHNYGISKHDNFQFTKLRLQLIFMDVALFVQISRKTGSVLQINCLQGLKLVKWDTFLMLREFKILLI